MAHTYDPTEGILTEAEVAKAQDFQAFAHKYLASMQAVAKFAQTVFEAETALTPEVWERVKAGKMQINHYNDNVNRRAGQIIDLLPSNYSNVEEPDNWRLIANELNIQTSREVENYDDLVNFIRVWVPSA